ncbi:MAG: SDR family NAD(P)-dependent oxidoreductase [Microthrixaceae bacterium]|nr:SDR family NAD(P)-dependent oxidoreductase [Microthrixaceae bacterium]
MSLPTPGPDRTALVTGASSGIGADLARELARRGHGLVLVARRRERLEELRDELSECDVRIEVLPADLSERAERSRIADEVATTGLAVDILVNNAGLSTIGASWRNPVDAELNMIEVDVAAVADLCTRFVPAMVDRAAARAQRRFDRGLPTPAGTGRLRGLQVIRVVVHARVERRAPRNRRERNRAVSRPGSHRVR